MQLTPAVRLALATLLAFGSTAGGLLAGQLMILVGPIGAGLGAAVLSKGRARFLAAALLASAVAYALGPVMGAFQFFGDNWPLSLAIFGLLVALGFAVGLVGSRKRG